MKKEYVSASIEVIPLRETDEILSSSPENISDPFGFDKF